MLRTTGLVALFLALAALPAVAELTPEDRAALQAVFDTTPLFDPVGARWVRARVIVQDRGREHETEREGWLLAENDRRWLVLDDQSRSRIAPNARADRRRLPGRHARSDREGAPRRDDGPRPTPEGDSVLE